MYKVDKYLPLNNGQKTVFVFVKLKFTSHVQISTYVCIYLKRYLQQNYLFIRTMTRQARVRCLHNIINYFVVGHLHTHLCIYAYVFLLRFYSQTLRPIYRTRDSNDSEET